MDIWIDGDACPKPIKDILFRAAKNRIIKVIIVANHFIMIPPIPLVKRVMVESGFDKADEYILNQAKEKDLVITSDIPLADKLVSKGILALSFHGVLFSHNNIKQILSQRNLNEYLRDQGVIQGGKAAFSKKDIQLFSNHLDKIITQNHKMIG